LYPAGKKDSPITYSGDRSIENLITFISEKGTHGIAVVAEPIQVQEQGKAAEAATPVPDSTSTEAAKETATETAKEEKKEETKEEKKEETKEETKEEKKEEKKDDKHDEL
jgi:protein disulfide-isomerase A1